MPVADYRAEVKHDPKSRDQAYCDWAFGRLSEFEMPGEMTFGSEGEIGSAMPRQIVVAAYVRRMYLPSSLHVLEQP